MPKFNIEAQPKMEFYRGLGGEIFALEPLDMTDSDARQIAAWHTGAPELVATLTERIRQLEADNASLRAAIAPFAEDVTAWKTDSEGDDDAYTLWDWLQECRDVDLVARSIENAAEIYAHTESASS